MWEETGQGPRGRPGHLPQGGCSLRSHTSVQRFPVETDVILAVVPGVYALFPPGLGG